MQHQAADFSWRVIAEVSRADTSEVVYLLRCVSPILALLQPRAQVRMIPERNGLALLKASNCVADRT